MFEESLRDLRHGLCETSSVHHCVCSGGYPPVYWNIDMFTGEVVNTWVDTLQSVWPGILVSMALHLFFNFILEVRCYLALFYGVYVLT